MMKIFNKAWKNIQSLNPSLPVHLREFKKVFFLGFVFIFIFIVSSFLFLHPVSAQDNIAQDFKQNTAPVTLDGRRLFKVSNSGDYTAQDRADIINSKLQGVVSSSEPIKVEIKGSNDLPTIWLNDNYLLTVTERDSQTGNTQQEQAQIWVQELENSLSQAQKERSLMFLQSAFIRSCFILALAVFCHWSLGKFWNNSLRKFLKRFIPEQQNEEAQKIKYHHSLELLFSLTLTSVRVGIWTATILYVANQFPFTRRLSFEVTRTLFSTLTADIITLADQAYSIPDILFLLGLLWALIVLAKIVSDLLQTRILNVTGINRGAQEVIAIIIRYCLIFIGGIVLLQVWGLDLSSLTILASALGVGIGFGFQDIAKNFGSGIVLLFERPIQVGDFVEIGEYQGIVERVGARSTVIKTLDMISIIVPNSRFLEMELINWDHDHPVSGLRLPVGVAYGSNIEMVRQSLLDVAKANPDILAMPSPQVLFKGFGESSLDFELRIWISQPSRNVIIKSNLYYQIEAIFRLRNIEIPFPQRDLHVRGSLPIELSSELKDLLMQLYKQQNNGSNNGDSHKTDLDSEKI
ncbi:mechanosensitive ion channel family protein [Capilliphycus salinus ALCB114379]|uniref:mechanosensitive ion channel family protein n=1 Tax=Capilliphycus salinus TaxID=2768948 RepID=UPI0039A45E22